MTKKHLQSKKEDRGVELSQMLARQTETLLIHIQRQQANYDRLLALVTAFNWVLFATLILL